MVQWFNSSECAKNIGTVSSPAQTCNEAEAEPVIKVQGLYKGKIIR